MLAARLIRFAVAAALAGAAASASAQEAVTLRLDTFLPPTGMFTRPGGVFDTWRKQLEKDSDGALKLQVNPGGTLGAAGRNPGAQLKLVTDGVTDISFVIPSTTPGRFPDDNLFGLPVADNSMEASLAFWRLYQQGLMRGYDDKSFVVVGLLVNPPNALHAREPVRNLDDMKGKKFQASGTEQQDLLRALGGTPVGTVTVRDTAEAISRGVVDGTLKDWIALVSFRISEAAHHHVDIGLGQSTILIAMNRAKYDSLSGAAKAALDKNRGEPFVRLGAGRFDALAGDFKKKIEGDAKHAVVTLPAAERARWDAAVAGVVEGWRKADARNEKLWQAYRNTLSQVRDELKASR